jgi:hypothetical protein
MLVRRGRYSDHGDPKLEGNLEGMSGEAQADGDGCLFGGSQDTADEAPDERPLRLEQA